MKMKKGLLSVAFLLATSSAMAAMSFSSADVKSDMSVSVKNTNDALLALVANADHAAPGYNGHGELVVDLNKGHQGSYGVQNDSVYKWNKLFTVKNNSEKDIEVTVQAVKGKKSMSLSEDVAVASETDASAQFLPGWPPGSGSNNSAETLTIKNASSSNTVTFKLAPGASKDINLTVETKDVRSGSFNDFDLNVSAKRTDGK